MRRLRITADDLGMAEAVDDGVEQAHRQGVLAAASLMVTGRSCAHAVAVARRNPALEVGLHLTLTDGTPALPPEQVAPLLQSNGRFEDDMAALGRRLATSSDARRALAAEIDAQIACFQATGLRCTHLDAHRNFHLHPVIAWQACRAAAAAGIPRVRTPREPPALIRRIDPAAATQPCREALLAWWLRRRIAAHGLRTADRVVGMAWSGAFTAERLLAILPLLPPGETELYFHPATRDAFGGGGPGYRHEAELAALCDPRVGAMIQAIACDGQGPIRA